VLWGGSFFFAEIAVEVLPPLLLVFLRVSIAALTLHVVLFARGRRSSLFHRRFPALLVLGLINNVVPFSLIFWAQATLASGIAAVINGMTPIFTMLLAAVLTADEKLTSAKVAGILIGFGGVAVMVGAGALQGAGHHVLPALALVAAAVAYALSAIFARRLTGFDPLDIAAGQLTGSTLIMAALFAVGLATGAGAAPLGGVAWPDAHVVAAVLALGIFSTAIAYLLYFALIKSAGATNASLVTYLVPVTAILLGVCCRDARRRLRLLCSQEI
jgi:drug/metabolite transporter (DMT)-like permease